MHKDVLTAGIVLLIIGIVVALTPSILGRAIEIEKTLTVPPSSVFSPAPLSLKAGDIVEGYFTVTGGADNVVGFAVVNPKGDFIYKPAGPEGKVYGSHDFKFTATMDGEHWLLYDNSFSLSSKTIYLTARISPFGRFVWITYLGGALTILGIIATIIGVIIKPKAPKLSVKVIYCVDCGAENPVDAVFCRKCGKEILKLT